MTKIIFPTVDLDDLKHQGNVLAKDIYEQYVDDYKKDEKINRICDIYDMISAAAKLICVLSVIALVLVYYAYLTHKFSFMFVIIPIAVILVNLIIIGIFYLLDSKLIPSGTIWRADEYAKQHKYTTTHLYHLFENGLDGQTICISLYEDSIITLKAIENRINNGDKIDIKYIDRKDKDLNFALYINSCQWDNFKIRCENEADFISLTKNVDNNEYDFSYITKQVRNLY